jgi:hypothetical protein
LLIFGWRFPQERAVLEMHKAKQWRLEPDSIPEEAEYTSLLDDLVEAERLLSLQPGSSVVRNTESPRVWWIDFNVVDSQQEWDPEYHYDYASEAGSDEQDGHESDQEMEGDDESEQNALQEEIVYEDQEQASASLVHRRHSASIRVLNDTAHATGHLGFDTSASISLI